MTLIHYHREHQVKLKEPVPVKIALAWRSRMPYTEYAVTADGFDLAQPATQAGNFYGGFKVQFAESFTFVDITMFRDNWTQPTFLSIGGVTVGSDVFAPLPYAYVKKRYFMPKNASNNSVHFAWLTPGSLKRFTVSHVQAFRSQYA